MKNVEPMGTNISAKKGTGNGLVAVAIDKDNKGSQVALKWAGENLLSKGQTVILIHVVNKSLSIIQGASNETSCSPITNKYMADRLSKEVFYSFHCFCAGKDLNSLDIIVEDSDVAKALTEYISYAAIEKLVLGAPSRSGFMRKFKADIPSCVMKTSPDFCTVYVISAKRKDVSSVRKASRSAPYGSPLLNQIKKKNPQSIGRCSLKRDNRTMVMPRSSVDSASSGSRSPIPLNTRPSLAKAFGEFSETDSDISFVSSNRPSTDRSSSLFFDSFIDSSRISCSTVHSIGSMRSAIRWIDNSSPRFSSVSHESASSCSSLDEVEVEMRRLRLELKQTMELYSNACREALSAKQQAMELNRNKNQEEQKLEEARIAEEEASSVVEEERTKCKVAIEAAEAAQKHVESKRRVSVKGEALKETVEMKRMLDSLSQSNMKYRRYTIEEIEEVTDCFDSSRKIGEGGYGPVYKCRLDHTPVAVKVLRPDAAQGRLQFLQEIEVLSCIRHPNMVILLGACPEYGILVYEYMGRGSLDDCLFRRGNNPALSWQLRFRIAAEVATGLHFLHQTKPEPIVHRDLKPGNILLDNNYVSKIGDVGLARLVPAVAENVTQCRITSTAGTFCYIDPEYQQTGMLGVKSDVFSLGILLLQLITAKQPMGLAHYAERSIENDTFFTEMADPTVPNWPIEETLSLAKLALRCAELRRKDRPDLGTEVLPELCRLRDIAEEKMSHLFFANSARPPPNHSQVSISQGDPNAANSTSSKSQSSSTSMTEAE